MPWNSRYHRTFNKTFIAYRLKAPVMRVGCAATLGEHPNESEDISHFG